VTGTGSWRRRGWARLDDAVVGFVWEAITPGTCNPKGTKVGVRESKGTKVGVRELNFGQGGGPVGAGGDTSKVLEAPPPSPSSYPSIERMAALVGAFGVSSRAASSAATRRIREITARLLGVEEAALSVREVRCPDEGCPDLETNVLVLRPDGSLDYLLRIQKPLAEVAEQDVKAAVAEHKRGGVPETTCSCCENYMERQLGGCGCCGWQLLEAEGVRFHAESGRRVPIGAAANVDGANGTHGSAGDEDGRSRSSGSSGMDGGSAGEGAHSSTSRRAGDHSEVLEPLERLQVSEAAEVAPHSEVLEITVTVAALSTEQVWQIRIWHEESVSALKERLAALGAPPKSQQRLILKGKELREGSLADLEVGNGTKVHLICGAST